MLNHMQRVHLKGVHCDAPQISVFVHLGAVNYDQEPATTYLRLPCASMYAGEFDNFLALVRIAGRHDAACKTEGHE